MQVLWLLSPAPQKIGRISNPVAATPSAGCLTFTRDEDLDEMIAAQEKFLNAVGFEFVSVQ